MSTDANIASIIERVWTLAGCVAALRDAVGRPTTQEDILAELLDVAAPAWASNEGSLRFMRCSPAATLGAPLVTTTATVISASASLALGQGCHA